MARAESSALEVMRAVERKIEPTVQMHYTAKQIAMLICKSDRWVKDCMKRGDFGPDVFFIKGEHIAAAAGVNALLERYRLRTPGILARTEGELRRKLALNDE